MLYIMLCCFMLGFMVPGARAATTHLVFTHAPSQDYAIYSNGQFLGYTRTDAQGTVKAWGWSASPFELRTAGPVAGVPDPVGTSPQPPTKPSPRCGSGAHLALLGLGVIWRRRGRPP